tara:strand:- start:20 stop:148 length:129 start_codon:yes stop_codon:yes gene_type:complete
MYYKKRKNWIYAYDKTTEFSKVKYFEKAIIDFAKYLKNFHSK